MTERRDGVYTTRSGSHGERLIQMPGNSASEYVRFVDEDTGVIRFVPVP